MSEDRSVVTFRSGLMWMASPVGAVREIADFSTPTPIPRAPGHILGLLNLRGHAIPVVDPVRLLQLPDEDEVDEHSFRRIVIIDGASMRAGFVAAQVVGVHTVEPDELRPVDAQHGEALSAVCEASFEIDETPVFLLHTEDLLQRAQVGG